MKIWLPHPVIERGVRSFGGVKPCEHIGGVVCVAQACQQMVAQVMVRSLIQASNTVVSIGRATTYRCCSVMFDGEAPSSMKVQL
jgi:hypothetical protein